MSYSQTEKECRKLEKVKKRVENIITKKCREFRSNKRERHIIGSCPSTCKRRCPSNFTKDEQKVIHESFLGSGNEN